MKADVDRALHNVGVVMANVQSPLKQRLVLGQLNTILEDGYCYFPAMIDISGLLVDRGLTSCSSLQTLMRGVFPRSAHVTGLARAFRLAATFLCPELLMAIDHHCPEPSVVGWIESLTVSLWADADRWFEFIHHCTLSLLLTRLLVAMDMLNRSSRLSCLCEMDNHHLDRLLPGFEWPNTTSFPPFLDNFLDSGQFLETSLPWLPCRPNQLYVTWRQEASGSNRTHFVCHAPTGCTRIGTVSCSSLGRISRLASRIHKPDDADWVEVRVGAALENSRCRSRLQQLMVELTSRGFHRGSMKCTLS
ncbi:MAG: hypothetical protein KVP17_002787 [Porospora cf. gigantea B]|uniref:uncharacterized protein n=1 Tax=Porospora cf. gigantea B TaxID=2853592 RepID=UPI003571A1D6|nr:MAG: hypothetical protein KVP17_002787 [Porospora cf. gigantea B]